MRIVGLLYSLVILSITLFLGGCGAVSICKPVYPTGGASKPVREFRAAWVATVSNINWPSKPGLSVEVQKQEAITMLDMLAEHHFNAVVLQVRPQCDALYASQIEPWSYYLAGQQGKAPEPFYDPLKFWIDESHKRGIELHAWFNPYRAHVGKSKPCLQSIVNSHPEMVRLLENGTYWLDPGLKETQDYSFNVVMDVLRRYDVDGIHFDDYFYPYPVYNNNKDFPDEPSWQKYIKAGGKLTRDDWRRDNVNQFICRLYTAIKREKRHVKFGLSPFGIWRPGYPVSVEGMDQYATLYADAKLWINKGWVDYFTPQLYWKINQIPQSFPVMLGWWNEQNLRNRHLWPGIDISHGADECVNQIMISRGMSSTSSGTVHWNVGTLMKNNNELAGVLLKGPYAGEALVPASPWLSGTAPIMPTVRKTNLGGYATVTFSHVHQDEISRWVLYFEQGGKWKYKILNSNDRSYVLGKGYKGLIGVSAVDRCGNESEICFVDM